MPKAPPRHRPQGWREPKARKAEADRRRLPAVARGYDREWAKLSKAIRAAEPLCRTCAAKGKVVAAAYLDHIVPVSVAPERRLDWTNLQPLCASCHSRKTATEDGGFGRAMRRTHINTGGMVNF